ncbi:hypothetical protein LMG9446_0899 [Lactococcus lactis subsp. lactis]|uniref:Uncharacterized protein n=1 Tax=Lactococcus lactis subsp. lactis TaxID=1360 RepID=A0A0V8EVF6_LACLL|nr:hypothetical protein LMG9446_0899 [Lactococcus lactis subsp. lactis]KSU23162.1 hypothetical protein M20_0233 [Lactococcus lactis subsp. lactis]KSU29831.1 hypothetical protein N42_0217 [Lactococcus lactis subsp. lactis]
MVELKACFEAVDRNLRSKFTLQVLLKVEILNKEVSKI